MTPAKAKVIFATHMQAARQRKLTAYELRQLSTARQVLRHHAKPAMNARSQRIQTGEIVYHKKEKVKGYVQRKHDHRLWIRWEDGEYSVVNESEVRRVLATPKGHLPNAEQQTISAEHADVFIHNKRKRKSNPSKATLIYGQVDCIYATKKQNHICDDECKKHGHRYFHEFSSKPKMYGLPDGTLLIKP